MTSLGCGTLALVIAKHPHQSQWHSSLLCNVLLHSGAAISVHSTTDIAFTPSAAAQPRALLDMDLTYNNC